MPKEKRAPSPSSDRVTASPYHCHCSPKTNSRNVSQNHVESSVGEETNWEEIKCPICIEAPHNAVLLLCSNSKKGCRPYVCNTSNLQSNCLDQFLKSRVSTPVLLCPLCRGPFSEWIEAEPSPRELMNSMPRSCSVETCEIIGTYAELEKHASTEHPSAQPSVADNIRQQQWQALGQEMDFQDFRVMNLGGDFAPILREGLGRSWHPVSITRFDSSGERRELPIRRTTARIRSGHLPRGQLARRET